MICRSPAFVVLPHESHTTLGGGPWRCTRSMKSPSFVSMTASSFRAFSKSHCRSQSAIPVAGLTMPRNLFPESSMALLQVKDLHQPRLSYGDYRMVNAATGKSKTGFHICQLQIWHFRDNVGGRKSSSQKFKHIGHTYPHAANARSPPTLMRVNCYSVIDCQHG